MLFYAYHLVLLSVLADNGNHNLAILIILVYGIIMIGSLFIIGIGSDKE